jgi:sulfite reductase alpha subunit-like flavoprotein
VRLVELEVGELSYQPGDVAVVQPANLKENVHTFFTLLPGLDPTRRFLLRQLDPNVPLPPRSSEKQHRVSVSMYLFRTFKTELDYCEKNI